MCIHSFVFGNIASISKRNGGTTIATEQISYGYILFLIYPVSNPHDTILAISSNYLYCETERIKSFGMLKTLAQKVFSSSLKTQVPRLLVPASVALFHILSKQPSQKFQQLFKKAEENNELIQKQCKPALIRNYARIHITHSELAFQGFKDTSINDVKALAIDELTEETLEKYPTKLIFSAFHHRRGVDFIIKQADKNTPLELPLIKTLYEEIDIPSEHETIELTHFDMEEELIEHLLQWLEENKDSSMHPVEQAFHLHHHISNAKPFPWRNKEIGRLLMNWKLLQHKCSPIVISPEDQDRYWKCLRQAMKGARNVTPLEEMLLENWVKTQQDLLSQSDK